MKRTWQDVDFAELLELDKVMTPAEIEDLTDFLNQEILYRVLNEDVPKILSKEEFSRFKNETDLESDLEKIAKILGTFRPGINLEDFLRTAALAVKKDFIISYLTCMAEDYNSLRSVCRYLDLALAEIKNDSGDLDKTRTAIQKAYQRIDDFRSEKSITDSKSTVG